MQNVDGNHPFERCRVAVDLGQGPVQIFQPNRLSPDGDASLAHLPVCLRIVLESVIRNADGQRIGKDDVWSLASWKPNGARTDDIPFTVGRLVLNDMAGIPLLGDLASMRSAAVAAGIEPAHVKARVAKVDMVIDHTFSVDFHGTEDALTRNLDLDYQRNSERFKFVKWAQQAFDGFRVIPPGYGILHQVNLEYFHSGLLHAGHVYYPDSLVGTDSHTCMIAGVSVMGWGVGGIEAQSALLGEPVTFLTPDVIGVQVHGKLREGVNATDLVLHATSLFRRAGVVGCFLEFIGPGVANLSVPDRATLANMAPEYGATIGFFPMDDGTVDYLRATGRSEDEILAAQRYFRLQGWYGPDATRDVVYTRVIDLDLGEVKTCLAGPKRPQDEVALQRLPSTIVKAVSNEVGLDEVLRPGDVVLASITSCVNTSNPGVMLAAGLVARRAVERGLTVKPWVKTSLAPGSIVVSRYLDKSGLQHYLDQLGFNVVGYGCATCIGNSGPLLPGVEEAIAQRSLTVAAVISGNRNFEGRIHPSVKAAYLASPPLVVAYAIAGTVGVNLLQDPIGQSQNGEDVFLKDIWPRSEEVAKLLRDVAGQDTFGSVYGDDFGQHDANWDGIESTSGLIYPWDELSTYLRNPPYFTDPKLKMSSLTDVWKARALLILGDSITTDHISPIGTIAPDSPAAHYLESKGVKRYDFNSYGSRRMNHEVMVRGAFANIRLRNWMVDVEGGWTTHFPTGDVLPVFDAASRYQAERISTVVFAGKEYGIGSARDWAAKATRLLGVRAVIAQSFEKIHRSNLVGMGVLPLQLPESITVEDLQLTGDELIDIRGLEQIDEPLQTATLVVRRNTNEETLVDVQVRIDTNLEIEYARKGGVLQYLYGRL